MGNINFPELLSVQNQNLEVGRELTVAEIPVYVQVSLEELK